MILKFKVAVFGTKEKYPRFMLFLLAYFKNLLIFELIGCWLS